MEKSLKVLLPILFTFLIKTVCYAQSAVNGQGYIGKGQVIHVLPKENISQPPHQESCYCFCNIGCAPVKVFIKHNSPNNPQPNNPFMQSMINQVSGWCITVYNPTNSIFLTGTSQNFLWKYSLDIVRLLPIV